MITNNDKNKNECSRLDVAEYYRRIRELDIGEIAQGLMGERFIEEAASGQRFRCPVHDGRSLYVDTTKQLWNCWGCSTGGDIIQLVEFIRAGVVTKGLSGTQPESHREARDYLAERAGSLPLGKSRLSNEHRLEIERQRQVVTALGRAIDHYHREILQRPDLLDLLMQKYGIKEEAVKRHRIGYCSADRAQGCKLFDTCLGQLEEDENLPREAVIGTGLFYEHEGRISGSFFAGRIVFPYRRGSRTAYAIGRATEHTPSRKDGSSPHKYVKLATGRASGSRRGVSLAIDNDWIFNEDVLSKYPDLVVVTEGIADCIVLDQEGIACVSPVTTNLARRDAPRLGEKLRRCGRVVICMDNEPSNAGLIGAKRVAAYFEEAGVESVRIATLPLRKKQRDARLGLIADPDNEALKDSAKIDVAEFFASGGTREEFEEVLAGARTLTEMEIDHWGEQSNRSLDGVASLLDRVRCLKPIYREAAIQRIASFGVSGATVEALREQLGGGSGGDDGTPPRGDAEPDVSRVASTPLSPYRITSDGRTVFLKATKNGDLEVPVASFSAKIVAEVIKDDGQQQERLLGIHGVVAPNKRPFKASVTRESFDQHKWMSELPASAFVEAGRGMKDHARAAIHHFSGRDIEARRVFSHLGWRESGGSWAFLHAGGAIGDADFDVEIAKDMSEFSLALPAGIADERQAVCDLLSLLDVAPDEISFPLLAAAVRAPLGEIVCNNFLVFIVGNTGSRKTCLTALAQSCFGRGFSYENLPDGWTSTANLLEMRLALAKDVLFVIDDFVPNGGAGARKALNWKTERVVRAVGNQNGRGRLDKNADVRATYVPKALLMSSGEVLPTGRSLVARMIVLRLGDEAVDVQELSRLQRLAGDGRFVAALSGYLRWLSTRMIDLGDSLPRRLESERDRLIEVGAEHKRTPGVVANLFLGVDLFLDYASSYSMR